MKTLAIIGASVGQEKLFFEAKELGLRTISFAWEKGAICKGLADVFYPISILDTESILDVCKKEKVKGVVSNCSDITAEISSKISSLLGLHGIPYDSFLKIKDKNIVRNILSNIEELSHPWHYVYNGNHPSSYPCVVKPCIGSGKKGVCFVTDYAEFNDAIQYSKGATTQNIIVEQFIEGHEVSVESISFEGKHYVVQITDTDCSGAPHFVEIGHHQPSSLPSNLKTKIKRIIPRILNCLDIQNGASHIELKVSGSGDVYLIEVNPRGGGGEISNALVNLSTDYNYVKAMISVALGTFEEPLIHNRQYSGIYFLCAQTRDYLSFFENSDDKPWLVDKKIFSSKLCEATSNYDRNGYLIYVSDKKIKPTDLL